MTDQTAKFIAEQPPELDFDPCDIDALSITRELYLERATSRYVTLRVSTLFALGVKREELADRIEAIGLDAVIDLLEGIQAQIEDLKAELDVLTAAQARMFVAGGAADDMEQTKGGGS